MFCRWQWQMKMVRYTTFLAKSGWVKHKVAAKQNDFSDCNTPSAYPACHKGNDRSCDSMWPIKLPRRCIVQTMQFVMKNKFSVIRYGKENMATSLNFLTRNFTKLNVNNPTCLRLFECSSRRSLGSSETIIKFEAHSYDKVFGRS